MKRRIYSCIALLLAMQVWAQNLKPTKEKALLSGKVTNFKGKILPNEIIMFENDKTKQMFKAHTNTQGKFQMLIPVNGTYSLKYKNFSQDIEYTKMLVPDAEEASYEVIIKIEPAKEFVLSNVYFETGKSNLKPSSYKGLNDLVEVLSLKKTMVVEIQGHTDDVGSAADNVRLSQQRADAVKKYLSSKGINNQRIKAVGYGALEPVADNSSEEGRAKNRRTSLKVISE